MATLCTHFMSFTRHAAGVASCCFCAVATAAILLSMVQQHAPDATDATVFLLETLPECMAMTCSDRRSSRL